MCLEGKVLEVVLSGGSKRLAVGRWFSWGVGAGIGGNYGVEIPC